MAAARSDLAERLGQAPEEIEVVSATPKQWSDSCLDVAYTERPDEVCAQLLTPGYEVVLKLGETVYTYHTDQTGANVRFAGLDIGGEE